MKLYEKLKLKKKYYSKPFFFSYLSPMARVFSEFPVKTSEFGFKSAVTQIPLLSQRITCGKDAESALFSSQISITMET